MITMVLLKRIIVETCDSDNPLLQVSVLSIVSKKATHDIFFMNTL
jgi:hypothetical protein